MTGIDRVNLLRFKKHLVQGIANIIIVSQDNQAQIVEQVRCFLDFINSKSPKTEHQFHYTITDSGSEFSVSLTLFNKVVVQIQADKWVREAEPVINWKEEGF